MEMLAILFTTLTAALHLYFFVLENLLWTKPIGLKTFRMSLKDAETTKVLAANQGVYNLLLALGLLATFFFDIPSVRLYTLSFITLAGCYGWYTLSIRVFYIQALPALIALVASL